MPYSFTQIEKQKSHVILLVFSALVLLYVFSLGLIATIVGNYFAFERYFSDRPPNFHLLSPYNYLIVLAISIVLVVLQWTITSNGLNFRLCQLLKAQMADPDREHHQMFENIVDEVSIATGGKVMVPMVIPSMALNAFSIDDGADTPVIGVTEGLLLLLNRSQIEAVVAHEAAHIVSGDSEEVTLVSSMFEVCQAMLSGIKYFFIEMVNSSSHNGGSGYRYKDEDEGFGFGIQLIRVFPAFVVFLLVVVLIFIVNVFAKFMRMFISRQREYRADAVAVRLTRNPLALAEALYIIGSRRRTLFDVGDVFESAFIISPRLSLLDEEEGLLADLFSTHPPLSKRIKLLLSIAHVAESDLDGALKVSREKEKIEDDKVKKRRLEEGIKVGNVWLVQQGERWLGPFNAATIDGFEWITPESMIKHIVEGWTSPIKNAVQFQGLQQRISNSMECVCPSCSGVLIDIEYERVKIKKCQQCLGTLVDEESFGMIFHRKEKTFDASVGLAVQTLEAESLHFTNQHLNSEKSSRIYVCKHCKPSGKPLIRRLFNKFYPVEIDKCMQCGIVWCDKNELEVIQYMFEKRDAQSRQKI